MDSCVCAALEAAAGRRPALIHFNYHQWTQKRESRAFHAIARHFGIRKRLVVDLSPLAHIGGSTLIRGHGHVPQAAFRPGVIPSTYVPFRNGIMLAYAAAWAEVIGAERLVIGAVEEDSSGYPDCRRSFISAFSHAVELGTRAGLRLKVEAPLAGKSKAEIVRIGMKLGAPFHLTWSCYSSERHACGECESCLLRLRGFRGAGIADPIKYRRK
jgi:7-cyano-7-deazaguanine synthase